MSEAALPHSQEVEKHVIGALLLDPDAVSVAIELLKHDDFYLEKHRIIFGAISSLFERGVNADLITVSDSLRESNKFESAGGDGYLMEVSAEVASSANVGQHCGIIKEKRVRRDQIIRARWLLAAAESPDITNEKVADLSEKFAAEDWTPGESKGPVSAKKCLISTIALIEKCHNGQIQGLQTQFGQFNDCTGGFCSPDSIVLAGRPAVGKTALALDFADYLATDRQKSVLFFSLEMTREQLLQRLICRRQGIDFLSLRTGRLPRGEFHKVAMAVDQLKDSRLFVDDDPDMTPGKILAISKRHKRAYGLDMVIVDNLSLIHEEGNKDRLQEVSGITRSFKKFGKKLDCPIMSLVHLSRGIEGRGEDAAPRKSDLRECGSIEQDADMVMAMHRPDPMGTKVNVHLIKQRNGPECVIPLTAEFQYQRFRPYEAARDFVAA